jgi:hypothetical protein
VVRHTNKTETAREKQIEYIPSLSMLTLDNFKAPPG